MHITDTRRHAQTRARRARVYYMQSAERAKRKAQRIANNKQRIAKRMKRYNRERRANNKIYIRAQKHGAHEEHKRDIRINARYDGYKHIEYIAEYARGRDTHASEYVRMLNAINDVFPELNELHTEHIYIANAPYRKRIFPPQYDGIIYRVQYRDICSELPKPYVYEYIDTRRAKCLIYNARDELVHMGVFKRTIYIHGSEMHVTLYNRAHEEIRVHVYVPSANTLHGHTVTELRKLGIEFYQYR